MYDVAPFLRIQNKGQGQETYDGGGADHDDGFAEQCVACHAVYQTCDNKGNTDNHSRAKKESMYIMGDADGRENPFQVEQSCDVCQHAQQNHGEHDIVAETSKQKDKERDGNAHKHNGIHKQMVMLHFTRSLDDDGYRTV